MGYLNFVPAGTSPSGKTKKWTIQSLNGVLVLGWIAWFPNWRKYTFIPAADTVHDWNCLREIADFIEARTKEHKA